MSVSHAVAARKSVRGFLPKPVPVPLMREILLKAHQAPSGGNLQPWRVYVVDGATRNAICGEIRALLEQRVMSQGTEYDVYPPELTSPYKDRRAKCGNDLYSLINVPRNDTKGKVLHLQRNWDFFGAPMGLFFVLDRQMGPPQWSDVGGYMQTVALLCEEAGLATCLQEAWAHFHKVVGKHLGLKENEILFCGCAVGYEDTAQPINKLKTDRAPQDEWLFFRTDSRL